MAGESASEVARRMRAKADRLTRSAALWERGAQGERVTADVLEGLPRDEWAVFNDIRWPGRPRANIDHVVLGPPGVFVIDAKNWSGEIAVRDGTLRQNGWRRAKEVEQVREAAQAVASTLHGVHPLPIFAVLCLLESGVAPQQQSGGVMLCDVDRVGEWMQLGRPILSDSNRGSLRDQLSALPKAMS